jgi:hypothetical protein
LAENASGSSAPRFSADNGRIAVLYALITVAFVSKLIDGFIVTLHLVDIGIAIEVLLLLFSARRLVVPNEWVVCVGLLYVAAILGLATPALHSGFAPMPIIPAYRSVSNFAISAIYESRFIVAMGIILGCGLTLSEGQWQRISSYVLSLLVVNAVASIVEYFWRPLHATLDAHAHYSGHFSFVYRGVSLFLNVYDASMSMVFLIGLSIYKWMSCRQRRYLIATLLGVVAMFLLGTRTGYITMVGYFIWLSFLMPMSGARRFIAVAGTVVSMIVALGCAFLLSTRFREIIVSILTLSDKSGSAQTHVALFWRTIELIIMHPFGVGIGKINFGSFRPGITYEPESWALALGLDCGILTVLAFYFYNARVFMKVYREKRKGAVALAALGFSLLSLSVINMQVFGSSLTMVLLPTLIATFLGVRAAEGALPSR